MNERRKRTHIGTDEYHERMKHRTENCERLENIHVITAAFPQPHPAAAVPLSDSGPSILWSNSFDPNEDCAKCEICVADFATHCNHSVTVCAGVLVEEVREGVKLFLDSLPGLLPLRRSKLGGWLLGLGAHEVGTATFMESEVSHGDNDWQKRLREDFMYVVDEEALHGTRSFGEDRSSRVGILEVLSYLVGVGERFPTAGIVNDGESVNWSTVGAMGSRGNVQLAKDVLNVGCFDPMGAVRETFVVENESMHKGHPIVHADEKKIWVRT